MVAMVTSTVSPALAQNNALGRKRLSAKQLIQLKIQDANMPNVHGSCVSLGQDIPSSGAHGTSQSIK